MTAGLIPDTNLFYGLSAALSETFNPNDDFLVFTANREVLIRYLETQLSGTKDLLEQANVYQRFESNIKAKLTSEDITALINICIKFTPITLQKLTLTPSDI